MTFKKYKKWWSAKEGEWAFQWANVAVARYPSTVGSGRYSLFYEARLTQCPPLYGSPMVMATAIAALIKQRTESHLWKIEVVVSSKPFVIRAEYAHCATLPSLTPQASCLRYRAKRGDAENTPSEIRSMVKSLVNPPHRLVLFLQQNSVECCSSIWLDVLKEIDPSFRRTMIVISKFDNRLKRALLDGAADPALEIWGKTTEEEQMHSGIGSWPGVIMPVKPATPALSSYSMECPQVSREKVANILLSLAGRGGSSRLVEAAAEMLGSLHDHGLLLLLILHVTGLHLSYTVCLTSLRSATAIRTHNGRRRLFMERSFELFAVNEDKFMDMFVAPGVIDAIKNGRQSLLKRQKILLSCLNEFKNIS
ncbi:hypothetical protein ACP70R_019446 [Stipagrostis hirtigluma subsp. patula]